MKRVLCYSRPLLFFFSILLSAFSVDAQVISPRFFSQNAWMPDTIGNASACTQPPCVLYGKLHSKWGQIAESGAALVRFGGIQPDKNMPTNYQYIKMIDSIRARGMEPIIQVPYYNGRYSASQAAQIVQYINGTKARNIKYWIIGNEPDHVYGFTTASQVAAYIKPFASAMKAVDPTIKIIGPETAWFNTNIMNGLTSPGGPDDITGTDANGRYYVDILSFHMYAFDGSQSRASMITKLMGSGGMDANLAYLNGRVANCNSYHGRSNSSALLTAVTEANVNWQNASTDNLNGTGVNSFIGGQFIAEMFGVGLKNNVDFINMWSVVEGNTNALNIGYIDGPTGNKKPAYHHFKMMSDNFTGTLVPSASTQTNVKVFSCKNSSVTTVLILNQDLLTNHNFTVRLDNNTASGSNALKINASSGIAQEYNDNISNQSTMLLQFDNQGSIIKKITYGLTSHAALNLSPSTSTFAIPVASVSSPVNTTPSNNLSRCTGKTATLSVNSGTNSTNWYTSSTSSVVLASGSVFVTPSLTAQSNSLVVTYYAEAANSSTVSARTPVTITVHPRPVITVNSASVCAGQTIALVPGGASTYTISGGSFTVAPLTSTAYYVSGTNTLGCTATISAVANITVNQRPVVAVNNGSVCAGSSFVLNPSGAASYNFSSGSATVTPSATSQYSVSGISQQGCASTNTVVATVSVAPVPVVSVNSGSICSGSTFTLSPTGANTYSVSGGTNVVSPGLTTTYTITGNNGGCASAPAIATVSVYAAPVISVSSGSICSGSAFVLQPSGAATYSFSGGSATVSPQTTTGYTISGTSAQGCLSSNIASATVSVITTPVVSAADGTICSGTSFVISPGGASNYTISGGSATVNPVATTSYSVWGINAGCQSAQPAIVTVNVNAKPNVTVNSGTICPGAAFVMMPTGAATYSFSGGSATLTPNANGSYTVIGWSSEGCKSDPAICSVSIFTSAPISVNSGSICSGSTFSIIPTGGSTYSYSGGSAVVSPPSTTSYTITGSEPVCGITSTAVATVVVNPLPVLSANTGSICQGSAFIISPSGANSYTVNGGNNLVFYPQVNTSYTIYGMNAYGCLGQTTTSVAVQPKPVVTVNSGVICRGKSFTMTPSGAQSYAYSSGTPVVTPNTTTSYTVTGTTKGCSGQAVALVTVVKKNCPSQQELFVIEPVKPVNEPVITVSEKDPEVNREPLEDSTTTGLTALDPRIMLSVFPNPTQGDLVVEVSEAAAFMLLDMSGNTRIALEIPAGRTSLNIADLPSGIYIVKINAAERSRTTKIIKR